MIRQITLENFQGFRGTQTIELAKFNMIFGANSSGKSSLIRALKLFVHSVQKFDSSRYLFPEHQRSFFAQKIDMNTKGGFNFGPNSPINYNAAKHPHAQGEPLSIEVVFDSFTNIDNWTDEDGIESESQAMCEKVNALVQAFPFVAIKITDQEENFESFSSFMPIDAEGNWPFVIVGSTMHVNSEHSWWNSDSRVGPKLEEMSILNYDWLGNNTYVENHFDIDPSGSISMPKPKHGKMDFADLSAEASESAKKWLQSNLERELRRVWGIYIQEAVEAIKSSYNIVAVENVRSVRETIGSVQRSDTSGPAASVNEGELRADLYELTQRYLYLRDSSDFVGKYKEMVVDTWTGTEQEWVNVGTGLSAILPILEVLQSKSAKLIYLPEPEQNLHPKLQGRLASYCFQKSLQIKGQVILETHSENMLLSIQHGIFTGKFKASDLSVIYTEAIYSGDLLSREEAEFFRLADNPYSWNDKAISGYNLIRNLKLDQTGDLIDPFPESFVEMRANYLYGSIEE